MTTLHALETAETTDFVSMPFGDTWSLDGDVARRVAYGASVLDIQVPGWAWKISARDLNMSNYVWCILGQLYGTYEDGLRRLNIYGPAEHGFNARNSENWLEWKLLRQCWLEEVVRRVAH